MKRILGIVVSLLVSTCYAQQGFHIGAVVGLNTVWITHQDDYGQVGVEHVLDYGVAPALNVGYNFTDNMGFQADFIYSLQGAKYQQSLHSGSVDRVVELNYFKIPVYFKYAHTLPGAKNVKLFMMGGPEIALLQSASIISNYLDTPYVGTNEKYRFESVDIELAGEAGADIYANSKLYFNLGIRIDYGLTDMNIPAYRIGDIAAPYAPGHNTTVGLIVGINYVFSKGTKEEK